MANTQQRADWQKKLDSYLLMELMRLPGNGSIDTTIVVVVQFKTGTNPDDLKTLNLDSNIKLSTSSADNKYPTSAKSQSVSCELPIHKLQTLAMNEYIEKIESSRCLCTYRCKCPCGNRT